jgi:hypothetical protein
LHILRSRPRGGAVGSEPMTSQYRAGQRVALIISELQDQGLTTSEIALELQQRGVLMRGAAVDPVADLCDFVRDIVADFAEAIGKPATEAAALRARAEAAETALAAARAEVNYLQRELGRVETYWRERLGGAR